ncbi:hypothetical protein [Microbacterium sp. AR7-10]|uniref:hypothetical protein n=1 Tax=Microbacterium sp. AR7-10 TaxID=1891970 RepID=UPI0008FC8B0E|nr:hypothetical protein [Microbacterium sp. AR7-10]OIU88659.1 hypothetical protein BFN01_04240 [Microbacterium sp. AR7-10]
MRVTPPDLEMWLTSYVRALAAAEGINVSVSNKEPPTLSIPLARPLIIIRDDSGPRLSHVTFDRSIGASVLAGTRLNDKPANDIARWLAGVLFDIDLPLGVDVPAPISAPPIAAVDVTGCNGPYAVPEQLDVARRYLTAQYVVAGSW